MSSNKYLLDANIFIRHLTKDDKVLSPIATKHIEAIAKNEIFAYTTSLIIHEVTYVLVFVYKVGRKEVVKSLKLLLQLSNLEVLDLTKNLLIRALDDFAKHNVDFPYCVLKQIALKENMKVLTFDKDFKKLEI